jgi:hypothetical protein
LINLFYSEAKTHFRLATVPLKVAFTIQKKFQMNIILNEVCVGGVAVAYLVEALCYKPGGRGIESL